MSHIIKFSLIYSGQNEFSHYTDNALCSPAEDTNSAQIYYSLYILLIIFKKMTQPLKTATLNHLQTY